MEMYINGRGLAAFGLAIDEGERGTGVQRPLPQPKNNFIKIPGGDGALDFSEALTGYPTFERRPISAHVCVKNRTMWEREKGEFEALVHGSITEIRFSDEADGYIYRGRSEIKNIADRTILPSFDVVQSAEPYRLGGVQEAWIKSMPVQPAPFPQAWRQIDGTAEAVPGPYQGARLSGQPGDWAEIVFKNTLPTAGCGVYVNPAPGLSVTAGTAVMPGVAGTPAGQLTLRLTLRNAGWADTGPITLLPLDPDAATVIGNEAMPQPLTVESPGAVYIVSAGKVARVEPGTTVLHGLIARPYAAEAVYAFATGSSIDVAVRLTMARF